MWIVAACRKPQLSRIGRRPEDRKTEGCRQGRAAALRLFGQGSVGGLRTRVDPLVRELRTP